MNIIRILLLLPLICSCSKGQGISLHQYTSRQETPASFKLCHGFSCTYETDISIPNNKWNDIISNFSPSANNARQEKAQIAKAIAEIEIAVNKISGMNSDRAKAENFEQDQDQMDCLDETINTSRYLKFIEKEYVFKWHKTSNPIHRGYFIDGMWPHNSATITEIKTNKVYAVDTYYFDEGIPPPIIPKDIWLDNWKPQE